MMRKVGRFLRNTRGATMPEFAMAALVVTLLMVFTVLLGIAFWMRTAVTAAAEVGARRAATFAPACAGVPTINGGAPLGGAPAPFDDVSCRLDSAANAQARDFILGAPGQRGMRAVLDRIQAQNVTVAYRFTNLGFAGGPATPSVTVTVSNIAVPLGIPGVTTLGPISVTATGEDLRNGGS